MERLPKPWRRCYNRQKVEARRKRSGRADIASGERELGYRDGRAIWYNYLPLGRLRTSDYRTGRSPGNPPGVHLTYAERKRSVSSPDAKVVSPDLALVSAIHAGDASAMASVYDRYSSVVYSVALRVLGDTGAAEDIQQEVFMQLWRNPSAFDASRGNLGAWLAVITRNRAIDALRKRRPETDPEDVVLSVVLDMAGEVDRSRVAEKVRGALSTMPAAQRAALEMAYYQGMTHTEIAAKTGEPLGTIKTRIRAGLMALRKTFEG